jgi:hypothetical protein
VKEIQNEERRKLTQIGRPDVAAIAQTDEEEEFLKAS